MRDEVTCCLLHRRAGTVLSKTGVTIMAEHNENFRDSSGFAWIIINLAAIAWITMPASIALSRVTL